MLEVYTRPYDPKRPVVCVDEASKQLVADVTPPSAMQPGQPAREDYESVAEPSICSCSLNRWPAGGM